MCKKRFLVLFAFAAMVVSCGIPSNLTSNLNLNNTTVVLSQPNFRVVKRVSSSVSATYVLGIGGLSRRALAGNAVADLSRKAHLTGSQALVNVTVKRADRFFIIVWVTTLYAEGTVIEFVENGSEGGLADSSQSPVVGTTPVNSVPIDSAPVVSVPVAPNPVTANPVASNPVSSSSTHISSTVAETVQESVMCDKITSGQIDKCTLFEKRQIVGKLYNEICNDVDEGRREEAVSKWHILKNWYDKSKITDKSIVSVIKSLETLM